MKNTKSRLSLTLAAMLAAAACALPAAAQTAAPMTASATEAAPAAAAPSTPARPIPRKRRATTPMAMGCEPVKDPWENICTIRKHAEVACSDLPVPNAKVARKVRKGAPPPVAERNPRQECIDAYMRNV